MITLLVLKTLPKIPKKDLIASIVFSLSMDFIIVLAIINLK
jgi:hypothetical protein